MIEIGNVKESAGYTERLAELGPVTNVGPCRLSGCHVTTDAVLSGNDQLDSGAARTRHWKGRAMRAGNVCAYIPLN